VAEAGGHEWDAVCLGDLFVDLIPHSKADGQWLYRPSPGGAPGNVAAGLARLGHRALMVARVGEDGFGRLLTEALAGHGVDVAGIVRSPQVQAGLSVVTLDEAGDRSFMFYHDRPADQDMRVEDIDERWLAQSKVLHVGILTMASPLSAAAQRRAMDLADAHGTRISCDVNFRPAMWGSADDMLAAGREVIGRSAIVKVSEEELRDLTGNKDADAAVAALWHEGIAYLSVTRGAKGALLYTRQGRFDHPGFRVDAVDTTGAGDGYTAALLSGVLSGKAPEELLTLACAAGAIAASRKGAMESLATREELAELVARRG
jgi:fructokinase